MDTATKRASALGLGLVSLSLVVPNGSIDQGDRQTVSHLYSGILAEAVIVVPVLSFGVLSIIDPNGQGVISSMSAQGQGVVSTISQSMGVYSIIDGNGVGVESTISNKGVGLKGKI
jgi:hypothetical protein